MTERIEDIAIAMMTSGKGLLAADESSATIKKRFDAIRIQRSERAVDRHFRNEDAGETAFVVFSFDDDGDVQVEFLRSLLIRRQILI